MKYSPWNSNPARVNPYTIYSNQGYQQPIGPTLPTVVDWARVLWPNGWLLTPAVLGIVGASVLGFSTGFDVSGSNQGVNNTMPNVNGLKSSDSNYPDNFSYSDVVKNGKVALMANVYTLIATAGISLYIVKNLFSFIGRFWLTLSSIITGTLTATLLYASMYFYLYRINSAAFSSNYLGHNVFEQYYGFIYFSATTITVGAFGDILPVTIGSRTLVNMEVLFFLFILSSGVTAMSQIRQR